MRLRDTTSRVLASSLLPLLDIEDCQMNDYTAAERLIAAITIYPDPDEPFSYEDGITLGCNAGRVLAALRAAGIIFKAGRRERRAEA